MQSQQESARLSKVCKPPWPCCLHAGPCTSPEVLRAGDFPLLPGKRNSPAEEQVSPGPPPGPRLPAYRNPAAPNLPPQMRGLILFPLLRILLKLRKTLLGMKHFQRQGLLVAPSPSACPSPFPPHSAFTLFPPAGYKAEAAATC